MLADSSSSVKRVRIAHAELDHFENGPKSARKFVEKSVCVLSLSSQKSESRVSGRTEILKMPFGKWAKIRFPGKLFSQASSGNARTTLARIVANPLVPRPQKSLEIRFRRTENARKIHPEFAVILVKKST